MKDFSKATPRPWTMCLPEYGRPHHIAVFIDGNKAQLATVDFSHLRTALNLIRAKEGEEHTADIVDVSYEAEEANAELIVTAVNNYDKMKEALEKLTEYADRLYIYASMPAEDKSGTPIASAKQLLDSLK